MKHIVITILLIWGGINVTAQNRLSNTTLERVEKLLLHHEIDFADSLLRQENFCFGNANSSYKEDFIAGLLLFHKEMYEESASAMIIAITKMDSLHIWDCENYLMTAYYIADSYIHLNKLKESESIINYALVKCANTYNTCIYAKKMYQLLLIIYEKLKYSPAIIEQAHNEIQKLAINIFCSNNQNKESEKIKESFMFFYNYITSPPLSYEDSINMDQGKAAYLYAIGEYDEAIRLYERVKERNKISPIESVNIGTINESLLVMYSKTANINAIESLLPELYAYSEINNLGRNVYTENIVVAFNLSQENHNKLAQLYYERCDSFLSANKGLPNWDDQKKNVLSKMIYNCRELGMFDNVIKYCKDYYLLSAPLNYEAHFFINYNLAYAYSGNENYNKSIELLENLIKHIKDNKGINNMDYIMANCMLGVCYSRINNIDKSLKCALIALDCYNNLGVQNMGLFATLNHNLGKAYLDTTNYNKALSYLNIAADIQIQKTGRISEKTQSYIEECKKH